MLCLNTFKKSILVLAFGLSAPLSFGMNKAEFEKLANETIKVAISGKVSDIDQLIKDQEKMLNLGVEGCKAYSSSASGQEKKLVDLVAANAEKMKKMTLEEIEAAWHDGGELKKNGITLGESDHMGHANSLADTIIHPATTFIALNKYKSAKSDSEKKELLDQVKDELKEVLEHLKHVK